MKLFLCLILSLTVFCSFNAQAQEMTVPYTDGIPLMNGFNITEDDIVIFDKPEGRIVEVIAWCDTNCAPSTQIKEYYQKTLSSMGWSADPSRTQQSDLTFTQSGQSLSLRTLTEANAPQTLIIFRSEQ